MRFRWLISLVVLALSATLVGCGGDTGTGGKGYVTGQGVIRLIPSSDRLAPAEVAGTTLDGSAWDLADRHGKPVVINVWASWCPPCRAEVGDLVAAANELGDDAEFVGLNIRDPGKAEALAFQRSKKVPYPSLYDPDGSLLLAFHGTLPPNALPSTVVIDSQGKVAALVLGRLPSAQTLVDLVADVEQGS